jgi:hypothetical protein
MARGNIDGRRAIPPFSKLPMSALSSDNTDGTGVRYVPSTAVDAALVPWRKRRTGRIIPA